MSDTATTIVETPAKSGERAIEKPSATIEAAVETGDISGVYRIAQTQVDDTVTRELGISKVEEPNVAEIAGPQIIALKQADAEFQNKTQSALGALKSKIDVAKPTSAAKVETPVVKPEAAHVAEVPTIITNDEMAQPTAPAQTEEARLRAAAVEAMKTGPLTVEEMVKDLDEFEAKQAAGIKDDEPVIPLVTKKDETMKVLDADIKRGVDDFESGLQKIDAELAAERQVLTTFESSHGFAHTPLENAYLDALKSRISALELDKKAYETSDKSYETMSKQAALKQATEKAETAYYAMYNAYMNQAALAEEIPQTEVMTEKSGGTLHLNEEDEDFEARQYEQFHPGATFGSPRSPSITSMPVAEMAASPMGQPPKQKGRMGKFIDSLKFWKYLSGKQQ